MALAGPLGNLVLVGLATVGLRIGYLTGAFVAPESLGFDHLAVAAQGGTASALAALLSVFWSLNLILFLLPVPPLDGAGVLLLVLPEALGRRWQGVMRHPALALLGILVAWRLFPLFFSPAFSLALRLLYPGG